MKGTKSTPFAQALSARLERLMGEAARLADQGRDYFILFNSYNSFCDELDWLFRNDWINQDEYFFLGNYLDTIFYVESNFFKSRKHDRLIGEYRDE